MQKNDMDRRVQKTHQLLKDALVALITEKGYEAVTIQELLDRANVGRSTFYFHFEDKKALLHSCFNDFTTLFAQYNVGMPNDKKRSGNLNETEFTLNFFRFVEQNHRLFKALLGKDGVAMFIEPIQDFIFSYFNETLIATVSNKKKTSLQLEMLANFLTSAFIGTLKWWIDKDMPCTAEEVNKYFIRFMKCDIDEVLG